MEPKAVEPALRVLESVDDACPREFFVISRIAIRRQPLVDKTPFLVREKLRRVGVVLDEPVCGHGHDNGEDAFLVWG